MNQTDIIRISCWRYSHDENGEPNLSSSLYVDGITAIPAVPSTLLGLYSASIIKGANPVELAQFYAHTSLVVDLKTALQAGNAKDIGLLIDIVVNLSGMISQQTLDAVQAALIVQRLVDTVAAQYPDDNITMPATITAAMVDGALGR